MNIIGQYKARSYLQELYTPPRFLLIVGSTGSGKKSIATWLMIEQRADYEIIEDQKIDSIRALIESCLTLRANKFFILPDVQNMNMQAQNALLKTLEQPPANANFIMTVNSTNNVLSTIRSRASILTLEGYSYNELLSVTKDETLLSICTNIGQIKRYEQIDYMQLMDHCEKVIDNLGRINLSNVFNILKHVDEVNYDLIIPTMQHTLRKKLEAGDNVTTQLRIIQVTRSLLENAATVNVKNALEVMFMKLWEVS